MEASQAAIRTTLKHLEEARAKVNDVHREVDRLHELDLSTEERKALDAAITSIHIANRALGDAALDLAYLTRTA